MIVIVMGTTKTSPLMQGEITEYISTEISK